MFRSAKLRTAALLLGALGVSAAGSLWAEGVGYYGYGKEATPQEIAGWDIDVRPDGLGLPPGSGSVTDGETLFEEKCSVCHGFFGEGQGRWPVLAGGEGTLTDDRPEKTVGSYWPYSSTLWDYIHRAMPFFNPQSLTNNEVYALTAYVLFLNDVVADDFVADQHSLPAVEMPNKDGFFRDNRPDAQNVACMDNCKDPNDVKIAWDASTLGVTPTDHFRDMEGGGAAPAPVQVAAADAHAGQKIYQQSCVACHGTGVAGAPKLGDKDAWLARIPQGLETLVQHATQGYRGNAGYMPPKGGNSQLSDAEVANAVSYMVEQSKAKDSSL